MTDNPEMPAPETATPAPQSDNPAPTNDAPSPEAPAEDAPAADTPANAPEGDQADPGAAEGDGDQGDAQGAAEEEEDLLFQDDEDESADSDGEKEEGEDGKDGDQPPAIQVDQLEIPEDMPVPEELKGDLDQFAQDMMDPNLKPQEVMQRAVDLHVKAQQHSLKVWNDTKAEWRREVQDDPEIGGANLKATKAEANRAVREIWGNQEFGGSEELLNDFKQDLKLLGLGNKRSFIVGMRNLARMIGEDRQGDGQGAGAGGELSTAEKLYGKDGKGRKS